MSIDTEWWWIPEMDWLLAGIAWMKLLAAGLRPAEVNDIALLPDEARP